MYNLQLPNQVENQPENAHVDTHRQRKQSQDLQVHQVPLRVKLEAVPEPALEVAPAGQPSEAQMHRVQFPNKVEAVPEGAHEDPLGPAHRQALPVQRVPLRHQVEAVLQGAREAAQHAEKN
jgi:hypothetical protein